MFLIRFPKTKINSIETQFENVKTQYENIKTRKTVQVVAWNSLERRTKISPEWGKFSREVLNQTVDQ